MKKFFTLFGLFTLGFAEFATAQQPFMGYHSSNYAGVNSIHANVANIVDSRFAVDINLYSWDFNLANNYLGLSTDLFRFRNNPLADTTYNNRFQDFRRDYFKEREIKQARIHQSLFFQGPSFSFQVGKNAFAVTTAARQMFYMDNMEPATADFILSELRDQNVWNINLNNRRFNMTAAAWTEIGIAYGRELWNTGEHYLKGAIHPKFVLAAASAYFYADELVLNFRNNDTLNVQTSDIRFGYSNNLRDEQIFEKPYVQNLLNKGSIAFDFGLVYEWRPQHLDYRRADDSTKYVRYKNKYKAKVAIGLHDLGYLRFDRGAFGGNFAGTAQSWDLNTIDIQGIESFGALMRDTFNMETNRDPYRLRLPTAFSLQADYQVWKGFYVNMTAYLAFNQGNAPLKLHALNNLSLTPRYEHKWFDVAVPLNLDGYGNWQAGLALRLGPLFIGSANAFNYLVGDYVRGLNVYSGLKIPIYYGKKKEKKEKIIPPVDSASTQPITDVLKDNPRIIPEQDSLNKLKPVEEPKVEEPKVEEPKVEEPKVEEPKVEEPKIDPIVELPKRDTTPKFVYEPPYYKVQEFEVILEKEYVYFPSGSATVAATEYKVLDNFANILLKNPGFKVVAHGYTDDVGDAQTNKALSRQRADAVKRYLVKKGIPAERIQIEYTAKSNYVADNKTEDGRQKNRRVEMIVVAPK